MRISIHTLIRLLRWGENLENISVQSYTLRQNGRLEKELLFTKTYNGRELYYADNRGTRQSCKYLVICYL